MPLLPYLLKKSLKFSTVVGVHTENEVYVLA